MVARIFIGPPGCGRSTLLLAELRRLSSSRHILAVTPSDAARVALKRDWGQIRGLELSTIRSLARKLLQLAPQDSRLAARGAHILSALSRRLLLRHAWQELAGAGHAPLYERYGDGPGALQALMPLFDMLAIAPGSARPEALTIAPGAPAELEELARVYRRYLELCEDHNLAAFQEVESLACDVLRLPQVVAALPWDVIVLDDLDAARPEQILLLRKLIDALVGAGRSPALLASAVSLENPAGDARRQLILDFIAAFGLDPVVVPSRTLAGGPLISRLYPAIPAGGKPPLIVEAHRPDEEAHAIAQAIAADLLAHPQRCFADYAIICWNSATLRAIRRVLAEYGITATGAAARPIAANPLTLPVRAGAALIAGLPLAHETEHEFLRGPLLALDEADTGAVIRLSGGLLALLEERATAALSDRAAARISCLAAALREARSMPDFSSSLLRWLECSGAAALLEDSQQPLPLSNAERQSCRRQIERALAYLVELEATAAQLGQPLQPTALVQALDEALLIVEAEPDEPEQDAVALWDPEDLYGRRAPVVFLAGMDEESLPRREPAIQPCTVEELVFAFGHLPAFVPPQQQDPAVVLSRARQQLAMALSRATERVMLSYSSSGVDRRPRLPSPLFLDLLGPGAIAGERLHVPAPAPGEPARALLQPGLGANNPPLSLDLAAIAAAEPAALIPHLEYIATLLDAGSSGRPALPPAPLSAPGFQASATHLRDYFTCPRRYFYARLLALDEEEGERLALGQLFHSVVERLFAEWDALAPKQRLRRGLALFRKEWPAYAHRLGPPLHQASYRRMVRAGLTALIAHEAERVRPGGRRPIARERRFRLTWRDGTIMTGMIDRVDLLPDGRYAVVDYKTGGESPSPRQLLSRFLPLADDPDWRPQDVQLPLYALAVEQGAVEGLEPGEVAEVSLLYPFQLLTGSGRFADAGWRRIQIVDGGEIVVGKPATLVPRLALQRTWQEIDRALAGMRAGPFPPQPRDSMVCRSCAYRFTCPQPAADDEGGHP